MKFETSIASAHAWRQSGHFGFWFRVFGYGLCISTMEPNFSERNGYTKTLRIGRIKIKALKPEAAKK